MLCSDVTLKWKCENYAKRLWSEEGFAFLTGKPRRSLNPNALRNLGLRKKRCNIVQFTAVCKPTGEIIRCKWFAAMARPRATMKSLSTSLVKFAHLCTHCRVLFWRKGQWNVVPALVSCSLPEAMPCWWSYQERNNCPWLSPNESFGVLCGTEPCWCQARACTGCSHAWGSSKQGDVFLCGLKSQKLGHHTTMISAITCTSLLFFPVLIVYFVLIFSDSRATLVHFKFWIGKSSFSRRKSFYLW